MAEAGILKGRVGRRPRKVEEHRGDQEMEKRSLVVDSSVVARWSLAEEGSTEVVANRDEFASGRLELAVPTLLFYEVADALRFSGAFSEEELRIALKSLSRYRFQA